MLVVDACRPPLQPTEPCARGGFARAAVLALLTALGGVLHAPADAGDAAAPLQRLGRELTPVGAERAGNADGSIPAWSGGLPQAALEPDGSHADPFAGDRPLFTIDAANAAQFGDRLSAGHRALLASHPGSFRMHVYPTRRSAALPPDVLAEIAKQAPQARTDGDRLLDVGRSAVPFPIPADGLQAMWNHTLRWRGGSVRRVITWFPVTASGSWRKVRLISALAFDQHGYMAEPRPNRLFNLLDLNLDPPLIEGAMKLVWEPVDPVAQSRASWRYVPLARRVQRIPSLAYDDIDPSTNGLRTDDQYDGWNGAPDRYDWKLVGKRELYIGYNAYRLGAKTLAYADILQRGHVDPQLLRYELHRVWVVEATLRAGAKHLYPRRVFYLDEDSWQVALEEAYDAAGRLWRVGDHQTMQFYEAMVPWYRATIHHDLRAGAYLVSFLDNEERGPWRWGWMGRVDDFTPGNLRRLGVR